VKNRPEIAPGDWLRIGDSGKAAVVCQVHANPMGADVEVIYLDDRDRAINEDVIWDGIKWQFKHPGPCGGYADRYSRLASFVAILRSGRRS
jgi:hypothetical protein